MKTKLTPAFVQKAAAVPGAERTTYWDQSLPGFGLMVTATGHRSYVVQYRAARRSRRMKIDSVLDLSEARRRAKALLGEVAHGRDPLGDKRKAETKAGNTLKSIAESYLEREGKNLRNTEKRKSIFERNIFPMLGTLPIDDIRRSDINKLLDRIEDTRGPTAADEALALLSRLFSWHATRSDEFRTPIVRGMKRTSATERARKRILSDDELRAVWNATGTSDPYHALVRFLLLTGARRDEAREMPPGEVVEGVWTIPPERYKTKGEVVLPLSKAAQAVLADIPVRGPVVFSTDGRKPIGGLTERKAQLDRRAGVSGWVLHDLRRTARSLMSRAGVSADTAERCLGHVIGGVRGVYDRHSFLDEKRHAFEKLAAQIERIVNPQPNVVAISKGSGRR